jgi:hypothetical protein
MNGDFVSIPCLARYDGDGYKSIKPRVNDNFEFIPSVVRYECRPDLLYVLYGPIGTKFFV